MFGTKPGSMRNRWLSSRQMHSFSFSKVRPMVLGCGTDALELWCLGGKQWHRGAYGCCDKLQQASKWQDVWMVRHLSPIPLLDTA